ncbi:hypothetical protein BDV06DRAFT_214469 [Aspergillus oleicola]
MALLDPSYNVFINTKATAKLIHRISMIMGDPLCDHAGVTYLFDEFKRYCRQHRLGLVILRAMLQLGLNRVLNPLTNKVVSETARKRILTQSRQLLNPAKAGLMLDIYTPSAYGTDYQLESQMSAIYEEWCLARNNSDKPQTFITEYDPFLESSLMTYIYSPEKDGTINGFAALRWFGANDGYLVDPCIAAPGARKGITDLLLFSSMACTREPGISYLSVGYALSDSFSEASGMPVYIAHVARRLYHYTFEYLAISGKKALSKKFKPDTEQGSPAVAVAHVVNISPRKLVFDSKTKPEL